MLPYPSINKARGDAGRRAKAYLRQMHVRRQEKSTGFRCDETQGRTKRCPARFSWGRPRPYFAPQLRAGLETDRAEQGDPGLPGTCQATLPMGFLLQPGRLPRPTARRALGSHSGSGTRAPTALPGGRKDGGGAKRGASASAVGCFVCGKGALCVEIKNTQFLNG